MKSAAASAPSVHCGLPLRSEDQLYVGREDPLGVVPQVLGQERPLAIGEGVGGSRELDSHHASSVGDTTDAASVRGAALMAADPPQRSDQSDVPDSMCELRPPGGLEIVT